MNSLDLFAKWGRFYPLERLVDSITGPAELRQNRFGNEGNIADLGSRGGENARQVATAASYAFNSHNLADDAEEDCAISDGDQPSFGANC